MSKTEVKTKVKEGGVGETLSTKDTLTRGGQKSGNSKHGAGHHKAASLSVRAEARNDLISVEVSAKRGKTGSSRETKQGGPEHNVRNKASHKPTVCKCLIQRRKTVSEYERCKDDCYIHSANKKCSAEY